MSARNESIRFGKAVGKGAYQSVKTVLSPQHWKEMAVGALHIAMLCLNTIGQEQEYGDKLFASLCVGDYASIQKLEHSRALQTKAQEEALNKSIKETCEKIKAMPWEALVEQGTELGCTMILDALAFNALNGFAKISGRALVNRCNALLDGGVHFTKEYAVEVAGFGKLIIEEGAEAATFASEAVKNDLALFAQSEKLTAQGIKNNAINSLSREIMLPKVKTFEQARNKALELAGDMGYDSIPWIGGMEKSPGYGKIIGRLSANGKKGWRVDWDSDKGMHINIVDYSVGKGSKAKKYCIQFEGNVDTFKNLLRTLNR